MSQLSYEDFVAELRSALHSLYDPYQLRRSSLAALFGVADRFDTPLVLQRILTDAIEALEPDPDEPPQSRAWRVYEVLFYQYVRQLEADAVANQMGLSDRQLRRERRAGIEALADRLWREYLTGPEAGRDARDLAVAPLVAVAGELEQDLSWVQESSPDVTTDVESALWTVHRLVQQPLARQHRVGIRIAPDADLPELAVHPVAFRQMVLNLLCAAIPEATDGVVSVTAELARWEVAIAIISPTASTWEQPLSAAAHKSVELIGRLARACGGGVELRSEGGASAAVLTLPALGHLPVLVVDDNADMLQLVQRYVAGTRYHVVTTQHPPEALRLVEEERPEVIVLDVMMPELDGLQMLAQLRQESSALDIPIVVCTILPQEALVRSLGADAFLLKPVSREAFLDALDSVTSSSS